MNVPFLDLRTEPDILLRRMRSVLEEGPVYNGPEVAALEGIVSRWCKRKHGIMVSSGTSALYMCLRTLNVEGGDVITTCLSPAPVASAIFMAGATPVFADITDDLQIDPKSANGLVTEQTKAIVAVHYTGKPCAIDSLMALGKPVIEDCSQAYGATYRGMPVGSWGDMASFSFNPMKVFAACGEAGMVCADYDVERLQRLVYCGVEMDQSIEASLNFRPSTLQAAILLARHESLGRIINWRRMLAQRYTIHLQDEVRCPEQDVYYTYTIQCDRRDKLAGFLHNAGIETKVQHRVLLPNQPAFPRTHCPNGERIVERILSLPCNEKTTLEQQDHVINKIREFYG